MKKRIVLYFLILYAPLKAASQKCESECYKIIHLDNTRLKTCYYSTLDSNADQTLYKTTYIINKSLKEKVPLWIITFNVFKNKDSISVSLFNVENDVNTVMEFTYDPAWFPVIFNRKDINKKAVNAYDLLVHDRAIYKILFTIYNPARPFIILNKFQPVANDLVTYELATLKDMQDNLDKDIMMRHINTSVKYWLHIDEAEAGKGKLAVESLASPGNNLSGSINSQNEESYYIIIAKAIDKLNKGDTVQANKLFNEALIFYPQDVSDRFKKLMSKNPASQKMIPTPEVADSNTASASLTDIQFDSLVHLATLAIVEGAALKMEKKYQAAIERYESAISMYNEALVLKPSELYPKKQIQYCTREIRNGIEIKRIQDSIQMELSLKNNFDMAIKKAYDTKKKGMYKEALQAFEEALKILDDKVLINVGYRQYEREDILLNIKICENQINLRAK